VQTRLCAQTFVIFKRLLRAEAQAKRKATWNCENFEEQKCARMSCEQVCSKLLSQRTSQ